MSALLQPPNSTSDLMVDLTVDLIIQYLTPSSIPRSNRSKQVQDFWATFAAKGARHRRQTLGGLPWLLADMCDDTQDPFQGLDNGG